MRLGTYGIKFSSFKVLTLRSSLLSSLSHFFLCTESCVAADGSLAYFLACKEASRAYELEPFAAGLRPAISMRFGSCISPSCAPMGRPAKGRGGFCLI